MSSNSGLTRELISRCLYENCFFLRDMGGLDFSSNCNVFFSCSHFFFRSSIFTDCSGGLFSNARRLSPKESGGDFASPRHSFSGTSRCIGTSSVLNLQPRSWSATKMRTGAAKEVSKKKWLLDNALRYFRTVFAIGYNIDRVLFSIACVVSRCPSTLSPTSCIDHCDGAIPPMKISGGLAGGGILKRGSRSGSGHSSRSNVDKAESSCLSTNRKANMNW